MASRSSISWPISRSVWSHLPSSQSVPLEVEDVTLEVRSCTVPSRGAILSTSDFTEFTKSSQPRTIWHTQQVIKRALWFGNAGALNQSVDFFDDIAVGGRQFTVAVLKDWPFQWKALYSKWIPWQG